MFEDREDCFCAAFDQTVATAGERLETANVAGSDWRGNLRSRLRQLLRLMDEHPGLARLCVVDMLAASEAALRRRARVLARISAFLEAGFASEGGQIEEPVLASALVGGACAVIHEQILTQPDTSLEVLVGRLMYVLVTPYEGRAEAEKELTLANGVAPRGVLRRPRPAEDGFDGLKMRLTYRTIRVLDVISRTPAASNREVATAAGVADQGQISKLLSRLNGLGLIENRGESCGRGGANAWHLTRLGARVLRTTHPVHGGLSPVASVVAEFT